MQNMICSQKIDFFSEEEYILLMNNYNIIRKIIRQELRRINEANEPKSKKDLEKAHKSLENIEKLIEELKGLTSNLNTEFKLLEDNLGLPLEDVIGNPDGLIFFKSAFKENSLWAEVEVDILDVSAEIEHQMSEEEEREDLESDPKGIAQKIRELNLVDEYLTMEETYVEDFYLDKLEMEMPSQEIEGEVWDILNKENRRGLSSEYGG